MKKVLVTGGGGFIGSHLIPALVSAGHRVSYLDRNKNDSLPDSATFLEFDLASFDDLHGISKDYDAIIHLASTVVIADMISDPATGFYNNVNSTQHLLTDIAAHNKDCLFIFASSDKVYGNPSKKNVSESDTGVPIDPYGQSKLMSELLITHFHAQYGISYAIFRPGHVFGPGQRPGLFVSSIISRVREGKEEIAVGDTSHFRNFVYVKDLVSAFVRCVDVFESGKNELNTTFNVASYHFQIQKVLDVILSLASSKFGKNFSVVTDPKLVRPTRFETKKYTLDCSSAESVLGWKPAFRFEDAISETLE